MKMIFFALLLSGLLTSCLDQQTKLERSIPQGDDAQAQRFVDLVRSGDNEAAGRLLDPSEDVAKARPGLEQIHRVLEVGEPMSFDVVGFSSTSTHSFTTGATSRTNSLTYQLHFPARWVVGIVAIRHPANTSFVQAARFEAVPDSLQVLNRFSLTRKSPLRYITLAISIACPVFVLVVLVSCIRTKVRNRWLWLLFIVVGLTRFRLNWSSGQFDFQPLAIQLFGAGLSRSGPYAPWIVVFSLPLGAVLFLALRSLIARSEPAREAAP